MSMNVTFRSMQGALLLLLLTGLCGCGPADSRPATVPVTATVNYQGAPVDGASVVFVPQPRRRRDG